MVNWHMVNVHNEPGDLLSLHSDYTRFNFLKADSVILSLLKLTLYILHYPILNCFTYIF